MEEEKRIRQLFADFKPTPHVSDRRFEEQLLRRIEAIEEVRRQIVSERRSRRRAMGISALAGFVAGIFVSRIIPHLTGWLADAEILMPVPDLAYLAGWIITGAAVVGTSLVAYDLLTTYSSYRKERYSWK